MKNLTYILVSLLAASVTVGVSAETLTLDECLRIALDGNRQVKAGLLSSEKAEILRGTSFDLDKTEVSLGQETGGGGPENGLTVSQDFEFPTVYVARRKAFNAEAALERSNLREKRNEVRRDVTSSYCRAVYLRQYSSIRAAQDSLYREFARIEDARYRNGEISRLDMINARRTYEQNRMELEQSREAYQAECRVLAGLLNTDMPLEPSLQTPELDAGVGEPVLDFGSTPQGETYTRRVELGRRSLSLARQELMPGFSVSAVTQVFMKGFNPYHVDRERFKGDFLGFEVGVRIPLVFGSQKARIRAAKLDVAIAETMREQAEADAKTDYQNSLNEYLRARRNLDYYTGHGMADADEMERLSQVSYRLGEISQSEHIRNMEAVMEMRLGHADAVNQCNQSIIKLNYLKGK